MDSITRVLQHHLPPWWQQKKNRDVINFSILLFFSGITWDSNPHYLPTCIPPYTSHSYSFFQVASRYDLEFESPIWILRPAVCGKLCFILRYGTGQIRDSARRDTNKQTNKQTHNYQTRELGSSGPYALLFVPWRPRQKKHRDVINSYRFLLFLRHNLGFEPALSPSMHPPIHFEYILILPSCFTLWFCIWKPYLNMHCGQLYVASCVWWYGTVRERYGIAPGVTQTHKQTHRYQIKAVWTLASARGYWSNVFCIATGIKAVWTLASARRYWSNVFCIPTGIKAVWTLASARCYWSNVFCIATGIKCN